MDKKQVLRGDESFEYGSTQLPSTVKDFWAWSMSRLIADGPRGDLAEFIVNIALGNDMSCPKRGWGEYDISYRGKGIEVKCSSLIQEWERDTPSKPMFTIAKTLSNNTEETETGYKFNPRIPGEPPRRHSDMYVFCLFAEEDRRKANPLNLDQWKFYIMRTQTINDLYENRKRISLKALDESEFAIKCTFRGIKHVVDGIIDELEA